MSSESIPDPAAFTLPVGGAPAGCSHDAGEAHRAFLEDNFIPDLSIPQVGSDL